MARVKDQTNLRKREKTQCYRARMRTQGLRLVQMWVPDTRSAHFKEMAREQSLRVSRSPNEKRDIEFVEALQSENLNLPRP